MFLLLKLNILIYYFGLIFEVMAIISVSNFKVVFIKLIAYNL